MASPTSSVVSFIKACLSYFRNTVSETKANDSLNRIISEANELPILSERKNSFLVSEKQDNIVKKNVGNTKVNQIKAFGKNLKERKYESSKLQSSTFPPDTKLKNSHQKNILAMKRNNLKKDQKRQSKKLERKVLALKCSKFSSSSISGFQANNMVKTTSITNEMPKMISQRRSIKETKDSYCRFENSNTSKNINTPSKKLVVLLVDFKLHNSKSPPSTLNKEIKIPEKTVSNEMPKEIPHQKARKSLTEDATSRLRKNNPSKAVKKSETELLMEDYLSFSKNDSVAVSNNSIDQKARKSLTEGAASHLRKNNASKVVKRSKTTPDTKLKNSVQKNILGTDKNSRKKSMKRNNLLKDKKRQSKNLERKILALKRSNHSSSYISGFQANNIVKTNSITNEMPKMISQRRSIKEIRDSYCRFENSNTTKNINTPSKKLVVLLVDFKLQHSKSPPSTLSKEIKIAEKTVKNEVPKKISHQKAWKSWTEDAASRLRKNNPSKAVKKSETELLMEDHLSFSKNDSLAVSKNSIDQKAQKSLAGDAASRLRKKHPSKAVKRSQTELVPECKKRRRFI